MQVVIWSPLDGAASASIEPVVLIACGNEAQVYMRNHGAVAGRPAWVDSIELWAVDDEGLVISVRAFWEPPEDDHVRSRLGLSGENVPTSSD